MSAEWTAVLNQTTWDVMPCSIEERLDISIVKTKKKVKVKENDGTERMEERREQRDLTENGGNGGRKDRSWWSCETIRYRFCHGGAILTASCPPLCLSHVGWLLMEPSYPGWTSVMKFYSSYWIWRWDLCLSPSCSRAFIAQPQHGLCMQTHSPAWSMGIMLLRTTAAIVKPLWIGLSTLHVYCILMLVSLFSEECWKLNYNLFALSKKYILAKRKEKRQTYWTLVPREREKHGSKLEPELASAVAAGGDQQQSGWGGAPLAALWGGNEEIKQDTMKLEHIRTRTDTR